MHFTRSQKIGLLIAVALITLSLILPNLSAASEVKVVGKVHLKKGAEVLTLVPAGGNQYVPFQGKSFKAQTFYILEVTTHNKITGYKIDGQGFSHDCPAHGEEIFSDVGLLLIIFDEQVDNDLITIELFETE
jgi:hypothetical protein